MFFNANIYIYYHIIYLQIYKMVYFLEFLLGSVWKKPTFFGTSFKYTTKKERTKKIYVTLKQKKTNQQKFFWLLLSSRVGKWIKKIKSIIVCLVFLRHTVGIYAQKTIFFLKIVVFLDGKKKKIKAPLLYASFYNPQPLLGRPPRQERSNEFSLVANWENVIYRCWWPLALRLRCNLWSFPLRENCSQSRFRNRMF